ncbi:hypothetical protein H0B56_16885 [Haloechinothrix sp. YIM 98757]|uniref:Uncharacterized protein n=1 Tax=Haloechinothrix aidingensis TaxID=2752311 RepID=A0A838AD72_9PSEU|nr:hypothetical protein [Haloechinothrix aidingensis]MBA0127229.1 hypothetical protein [Haloechinothrix aidingensis]
MLVEHQPPAWCERACHLVEDRVAQHREQLVLVGEVVADHPRALDRPASAAMRVNEAFDSHSRAITRTVGSTICARRACIANDSLVCMNKT